MDAKLIEDARAWVVERDTILAPADVLRRRPVGEREAEKIVRRLAELPLEGDDQ